MFIDLLDALRCVAEHEESHLVAIIDRLEGRYIASGSLGCPVCSARYPIRDFVTYFDDAGTPPASSSRRAPVNEDEVLRLAALLDARVAGSVYLLTGVWGRAAAGLAASYDVSAVLVNPPADLLAGDGLSIVRVGTRIPLAAECVAGAAVDDVAARTPHLLAGCLNAVRRGGRAVAPASVPVPAGIGELARDGEWWVGERQPPRSDPVPLVRRRSE